jgi:hypothetical protein
MIQSHDFCHTSSDPRDFDGTVDRLTFGLERGSRLAYHVYDVSVVLEQGS